ncbi:fibrobacter succinogenes major paralogous domain-containing protein [Fibrobacter sp. UWEL]|uniref:fibrobacter succinogenes major paralogous domain-containing protein n=1 Tax=Fibrobacter sp. UWEL TaxID=1896209 RepID=UPI00090FADAE|nr:fibrobacter succinogenes major paralogous domain-containing protein [Fibrobacter sp. UWEL]SHK67781.1 major paralogous domain-containing protein [Fibrobacter sp. UWEL]
MKNFSLRVILNEMRSMKLMNLAMMLMVAAMFVACSDDSGTSSSNVIPNEISYGTLTDSRDNQTYKTVTIGTQTWMAENLNYDYNEGTAKSFCYDNSADSCAKYGRLYMWSAAMDSAAVFSAAGKGCGYGKTCASTGSATLVRGVCPEGWHLPSKDEWNTLFDVFGGLGDIDESDLIGFSVLHAGHYYSGGDKFLGVGEYAFFWSSTELDSETVYYYVFLGGSEVSFSKNYSGYSVRCLKD